MCVGPEIMGALQMFGAVTSVATGLKSLFGGQQQQAPAVAATSPVADDNQAKADAEGKAIQDKNARMKLAQSSSLLSNTNGAAGDLSTANVSRSGAKSTLGA